MKRRDYDLIAKVIREFPQGTVRVAACKKFIRALTEDNANFNSEQFITACGLGGAKL